ncbi:MAG: hypothetical protein WAM05_18220 [Candidatus Binataceae bacterium]
MLTALLWIAADILPVYFQAAPRARGNGFSPYSTLLSVPMPPTSRFRVNKVIYIGFMAELTLRITVRAGAAIAFLAVCCGLAIPVCAQAASSTLAQPSKLASYDWSASAAPNLTTRPPPEKIVDSFLRASVGSYSDLEDSAELCSFHFADLRHNGFLTLVAGTGVADRPSCRDVYIIDKTASGFEIYAASGAIGAGGAISGSIQDLRHNGNLEFILDDPLGSYGNQCIATWPVIYAWTGSGYTNVSDRYPDFYRRKLDSLNNAISVRRPSDYQRDEECLLAEAAKIQRFLGTSPEAGLDQAIHFATSSDSDDRYFAEDLLGHIGTPKAQKYLAALAKVSDTGVAYMAKAYLSALSKGPIRPTEAFQRVQQ